MAAKPPKPPGNFLNSNFTTIIPTTAINTENNNNKLSNQDENTNNNDSDRINNNNESNGNNLLNSKSNSGGNTTSAPTCNCSNISIMHLFYEMKQEFPTIPDQIVTQCVNENCHQRENCILMLRNELALNPIPAQTYTAKVLQRQQQQQKLQQQKQKSNISPLKPIRSTPLQPPVSNSTSISNSTPTPTSIQSGLKLNSTTKSLPNRGNSNCDSVSVNNDQLLVNTNELVNKDVETLNFLSKNTSDMLASTITAIPTPTSKIVNSISENSYQYIDPQTTVGDVNNSISQEQIQQQQRLRPTTLNLNISKQQQQLQPQQQHQQLRHQLNVQLQQRFQQLNSNNNSSHAITNTKPVRKAPLPPIPPKPSQLSNHNYTPTPLRTPPPTQHSSTTSLSSPISSGESEISVNVSLSSPTTTSAAGQQHLKSPVRHRSVITVQPEPPYTRDFLVSPTSSSGGSSSTQKSFTSVNLTLRQPNTSTPQSTIDISAGPGLSGVGTGLTYSSTSFDARRGCQKNIHITVTDEGGIFSASRIRPRSCYSPGEQVQDGIDNISGGGSGGVGSVSGLGLSPIRSAASEQNLLQQQQQNPNYHYQQQQQYIAATAQNTGEMCLPRVTVGYNEILQRQRARKDKLSTALRDNKKRLSQVEQEINILTEPVSPGESQRLDSEIQRLRCDCEAMLNEIENSKRCAPTTAQPPQPFPRPPRPPPPVVARQPQLDFVQHHVVSPISSSTQNSPNPPVNAPATYQELQQQIMQQQQLLQQQQQQYLQQQQSSTGEDDYTDSATDEEGGDEEDDEGLETWACNMCTFRNHPQLNICECCDNVRIIPGTIRIVSSSSASAISAAAITTPPPQLLTHLSNGLTASAIMSTTTAIATPTPTLTPTANATNSAITANASSSNLGSDSNLIQQQLQQFALHT